MIRNFFRLAAKMCDFDEIIITVRDGSCISKSSQIDNDFLNYYEN